MNNRHSIVWTFLFAITLIFSSCTNNSDDNLPGGSTDDILAQSENWKVSYYWDKDKDETSDFAGYTFSFKSGGVFQATFAGSTTTGTWQVNDSSNKLIINIAGTKPLDDLNDDWLILEKSNSSIKLKDDNNTQLEELHFQAL